MLEQLLSSKGQIESRDNLAELFAELGYKIGAEVGVKWGLYSEVLLKTIPDLKLFCVDPWTACGETPSNRKQERYFRDTQRRLAPYNVEYIRKVSVEALSYIPDGSLDFVYIDGAHDFENVMLDIIGWSHKVRSGGIVSGHDYIRVRNRDIGVISAVDAYVKEKGLILHLTNDKDKLISYFWGKK